MTILQWGNYKIAAISDETITGRRQFSLIPEAENYHTRKNGNRFVSGGTSPGECHGP